MWRLPNLLILFLKHIISVHVNYSRDTILPVRSPTFTELHEWQQFALKLIAIWQSYNPIFLFHTNKKHSIILCFFPMLLLRRWQSNGQSICLVYCNKHRATERLKMCVQDNESESSDKVHTPPWSWVSLGYNWIYFVLTVLFFNCF